MGQIRLNPDVPVGEVALKIPGDLLKEGYKVITAKNGKEAVERLRNEDPDMMILDINMPLMDGYQVCKEVREDPLYRDLPIMFLSIRSEKNDILKGIELGSDEYLTKPFSPKELVLRIKKILKSRIKN